MTKKVKTNTWRAQNVKAKADTDRTMSQMQAAQYMMAMNTSYTLSRAALNRMLTLERDYNFECNWPDNITVDNYSSMFAREGLARRCVMLYPDECWAMHPEVYEDEAVESTEFESSWNDLNKNRNVIQYLRRADILSGIGRFGVLLLGINDGQTLEKPVDGIDPVKGTSLDNDKNSRRKTRELLYMMPFGEADVKVKSAETDPKSPRYSYPKTYQISMSDPISDSATKTIDVHWTRVLHLADNRMSSEVYGIPRLECVYNRVKDIQKVLGGSAEMFWKGGFPGLSFEQLPEVTNATIDSDAMKEQVRLYFNSLQRYLAPTGMTVKELRPQVADPTGHFKLQLEYIAISLGVPLRILLGSEAAKLASTQDDDNWAKRLRQRQLNYLDPLVLRPFIDRMIQYGILVPPKDDEYFTKWPDLLAPSDDKRAKTALIKTEAMAKYVQGNVNELVPPEQYFKNILEMSQEEVDEMLEASEEYHKQLEEEAELNAPVPSDEDEDEDEEGDED